MKSKKCIISSLIISIIVSEIFGQVITKEQFINPPIRYWPKPLWFWNNTTVEESGIEQQMQACRDLCGYGGFGIVPFGKKFRPYYLSEDYFNIYGKALEKAKELGMSMCMYDEFGFPSGGAGAVNGDDIPRFQLKFPEQTIKRLDKIEEEITGPSDYVKLVPTGKLMGVVAMGIRDLKRIDITSYVVDGKLRWNVPAGRWKIMFFVCVKDGEPISDYLDPEAVRNFIRMTHEAYYNHFKEYFGTVITGSFFDEPSMFHAQYRMWTDQFNEKFEKKYGFSPVSWYPALWYDIGPETQSARNHLFGFRADLYAEGFNKEVNDWSKNHGITATGHTAPEEVLNPVNSAGDLMKSFKYLEIPGIDKIGGDRPAERFYKVISSTAYNWDRSLVMSETYGAMPNYDEPGDLNWNQIFSIAMDQYAKGINMLIPHAVWYDNQNVTYKPELSYRNPLYADSLQVFTRFLARLNLILQNDGRHVADIAVLYPIHSLLGEHYFDAPAGPADEFFKGDSKVTLIDYVDVANWLTEFAGKDYTFLHPEVLDEKCHIINGKLHLQNPRNWEEYQVLIVPSCNTMSVSNLQKIKEFYEQGGKVIFTGRLPMKSVENGKDKVLFDILNLIFPSTDATTDLKQSNENGGLAFLLRHPNEEILRKILVETSIMFDVDYSVNPNIRYIHKVADNHDLFYFANIGDTPVNTSVSIRGTFTLKSYDPHSSRIEPVETKIIQNNQGMKSVSAQLILQPFHSCFWVSEIINSN
jgi:hypothetical protein